MNIETERKVSKKITIDLDSNDVETLKEVTIDDYEENCFSGATTVNLFAPNRESSDLLNKILKEVIKG